jgi:alpha-glucosidase
VAWKRWRRVVDDYQRAHEGRELFLIAEANPDGDSVLQRAYVNSDEFHQSFAFGLMTAPWNPLAFRREIDFVVNSTLRAGNAPAWTLNNHDAQRSTTRYGRADAATYGEDGMNNLYPSTSPVDLALGTRRAVAAALLELALPGAVYLYAGEELGLPEVLDLEPLARQDPVFYRSGGEVVGRDGCRIPLPWTRDSIDSYGFSMLSGPEPSWLPQPNGWGAFSVEQQRSNALSTWSTYRQALSARRELLARDHLAFEWLSGTDDPLLVFRRDEVVVAMNLTSVAYGLPAEHTAGRVVVASSISGHSDPTMIEPDHTLWLAPEP